jgi:RNA polymerase subunit RPABC4/transcription elongation factor Spt4
MSDTRQCPACLKVVPNKKFCVHCGDTMDDVTPNTVPAHTSEPQQAGKWCRSCGTHVTQDLRFCPNCASPLSSQPPTNTPTGTSSSSTSTTTTVSTTIDTKGAGSVLTETITLTTSLPITNLVSLAVTYEEVVLPSVKPSLSQLKSFPMQKCRCGALVAPGLTCCPTCGSGLYSLSSCFLTHTSLQISLPSRPPSPYRALSPLSPSSTYSLWPRSLNYYCFPNF